MRASSFLHTRVRRTAAAACPVTHSPSFSVSTPLGRLLAGGASRPPVHFIAAAACNIVDGDSAAQPACLTVVGH